MASIYARGGKLWCRVKDETGKWTSKPTPYQVGTEPDERKANARKAKRFAAEAQKTLDARRAGTAPAGPLSVKGYAAQWIKERRERGVRSAASEEQQLNDHALSTLGSMALREVRPRHVRDLVRALRSGELAPRTVRNVYGTVRTMFRDAVVEELIEASPCVLKRGDLPKKRDKDPEWRAQATYTVDEVERLISDPEIPVERRVLYALKALAGLRHGEAAALRWRHYDTAAEPLGRLNIALAYDSNAGEEKTTKTESSHGVPVHPALAKLLAAWKLSHWERIYGRAAEADDLIVPTRTLRSINKTDAARAMKEDLKTLGLRVEAGKHRSRGGHDLRAWFQTRTVEDGADSIIIDRVTHAPPTTVAAGYMRFSWAVLCREVAKLRISAEPRGLVLELATGFATAEKKARGRWRKVVTPPGLDSFCSAGRFAIPFRFAA